MPKKLKRQQLRIIGGQYRGRKLSFPDIAGLRPTPDRVRETLFNWLAPHIKGARCLDLFAGSGVLAFEALSRGASHVTLCDQSAEVVEQLQQNAHELNLSHINIMRVQAPACLTTLNPKQTFDIVFLDPPFHQNLVTSCCTQLESLGLLNSPAYIYIETESTLEDLSLPSHWDIMRSKKAGQVRYQLVVRK